MAKVLYLIMSGEDSPEKFRLALLSAMVNIEKERFKDLKIMFFGPSQKYMLKAPQELKSLIDRLGKMGAIDSACIMIARELRAEKEFEELGIRLEPAAERLAWYVNNGYQIITF